ncbi:hypothetical protein PR003_g29587 [Phytophthora rubi]|uniref:Uncharacterized protein n=1 Tax=Phytophthora rubi TaxID=129364 RepID=A0A6A4BQG0_9STRA|nr:hypothetical protein PR003_g29587 [Phytophthora rubi]
MDRVGLYGVANATNIEASSASELSDYYHIGAVAPTLMVLVRGFGGERHEHRGHHRLKDVLRLPHRRNRRHIGGLSESLRRGERHEHRGQQRLKVVVLLKYRRSRLEYVHRDASVATSMG